MPVAQRLWCMVVCFAACLCAGVLRAEYPEKPVRFIVPFAPGGGTDIVGRLLAQKLNDAWGVPVIVDNRPGAGSSLGTALAVKAAPDGYTMVLSSISMAFNASLYQSLPFDVTRDLAAVSLVAVQPNLLVINPRLGASSLKELLALARARPRTIKYASGGNGSGPHLATELLQLSAQVDLTHVPYKGTGPALTDLLAGNVDMMIAVAAAALPQVRAGKLRALAVTDERRIAAAPEIPTMAEAGVAEYEFKTWYGVQVPRKTSAGVVARINDSLLQALRRADVIERFGAVGLEARGSSPAEFEALIRSEIRKWAKVVKASGAIIQ